MRYGWWNSEHRLFPWKFGRQFDRNSHTPWRCVKLHLIFDIFSQLQYTVVRKKMIKDTSVFRLRNLCGVIISWEMEILRSNTIDYTNYLYTIKKGWTTWKKKSIHRSRWNEITWKSISFRQRVDSDSAQKKILSNERFNVELISEVSSGLIGFDNVLGSDLLVVENF